VKAITTLLALGIGFILCQPLTAQAPALEQVLKNMEQGSQKFPSIQADIQRRPYNKKFDDLGDPTTGKIWVLRTSDGTRRIKIDFDKPQKEYLLIERNAFTHYTPKNNEGQTKSFSNEGQAEGECVFLGLCQSSAVIQKNYDAKVVGQETIGTVKTTVLELKSRDTKRMMGISVVKLWLDPSNWIPVQTRIYQENGNYTEAKYTNIKAAKFSDSVFALKLPKDANITTIK